MIFQLLEQARSFNASDLHLSAGSVPKVRINGVLSSLGEQALSAADIESLAASILKSDDFAMLYKNGQVDCGIGQSFEKRFRVNVFRQQGSIAMAVRIIQSSPPSCTELGLPQSVIGFTELKQGLVLIGGPTGSGKSTTLAALINKINQEQQLHIITLEDPIEYIYSGGKSLVNQREVGRDTNSFASGLRAALREDPDVIMVGELRDAETMATALTAAETGHLVLATIHINDAVNCVNRILDMLPERQIKAQLADCLQGIVCQRLVVRSDGQGRIGAFEVLVATDALRSLIRDGKTCQISSYLQTGAKYGMVTLSAYIEQLRKKGLIK